MSDAIIYCDNCARIILPSTVTDGGAIVTAQRSLCPDCANKLPTGVRNAMVGPPSGGSARVEVSRGSRSSMQTVGRQHLGGGVAVAVVGAAIGAIATFGVAFLVWEPPPPQPESETSPGSADTVGRGRPVPSPVTESSAEGESPASAAARAMTELREMIDPALSRYAEVRGRLEGFPAEHRGTPEVDDSRDLLIDIDVAYAKLAERALDRAVEAARTKASRGEFDDAVSDIKSVASEFAEGTWLRMSGNIQIAAELAKIEKLRDARDGPEVIGEGPATDVASLALAPGAEVPPAGSNLSAALAEFDVLISKPDYAAAEAFAETEAAKPEMSAHADTLRAAGRIAEALQDRPAAARRGIEAMVGKEIRLKTISGIAAGELLKFEDDRLHMVTRFTINNQKRDRSVELDFETLHPEQVHELAVAGGWDAPPVESAVARAYVAFASSDLKGAELALAGAGSHALVIHLTERLGAVRSQAAYDKAVAEAKRLAAAKRWKKAVAAYEAALDAKPDDPEVKSLLADAKALFAKAVSAAEPAASISLELADGVNMELVYIRPGQFLMGSNVKKEQAWRRVEEPPHEVAITEGFYVGTYEVTRAQFAAFADSAGYRTDAEREGKSWGRRMDGSWGEIEGASWRDTVIFQQTDDHPAACISWNDAKAFCNWATGKARGKVRLPTEAEWEYACRAGSTGNWSYGDDESRSNVYIWFSGNAGWATHPVGQKQPNAWGLHDVHGNMWEWVADWASDNYYASSPSADPPGPPSGDRRVLRGGSWHNTIWDCRSAIRDSNGVAFRQTYYGFRCAMSIAPGK